MDPKHIVTQALGITGAAWLVRWGWREFRRDWHQQRRLPLVTGPYINPRVALVVLGALAVLVPLLIAIMKFELVPKGSPALFAAMLSWVALAFTFLLLGATTGLARRYARGWITLVGDDGLRVEADGTSATLKLRPGVATLRAVEDAPEYVQLDIDDGTAQAHVWGMVGLRGLKYLAGGLTPARGLMVATSMAPLCHRLAPYFVKSP